MTYRSLKVTLLYLLLIGTHLQAWHCVDAFTNRLGVTDSFFESYLVFREDSLNWKVKNQRHSPLIVEDYCFNNVRMIGKGLKAQVILCDRWAIKADGNYSFAYNKPHGSAFDLSVGVGYSFAFCNNSIRVTPFAGYEINRQHFHSCNNFFLSDQCKGCHPVTLSPLHESYDAHWDSPWVGLDLYYNINECWKVYSDFAYHFVHLSGKGHTEFGKRSHNGFESKDQFHQRSDGYGFSWDAGVKYALGCNWLLDLGTQFEYRKTDHGRQHSRHRFKGCKSSSGSSSSCWSISSSSNSSSSSSSSSSGQEKDKHSLKRVEWRSLRLIAGITYRF